MGYIVPFLTISSILIDVCFTNLIFIGAIFNSYNYWYLLSYSNQFTLHYSILFLIISIIIIVFFYYYIKCYIKFTSSTMHSINSSYLFNSLVISYSLADFYINNWLVFIYLFTNLYISTNLYLITSLYIKALIHLIISYIIVSIYSFIYLFNLISYTFFSNFTFFIPIFLDFFLIFSIFFFKGTINCIEVFTGFNPCYSILFYNFFSLFFQFQIIIIFLLLASLLITTIRLRFSYNYYISL
jgi:hypothetical protein